MKHDINRISGGAGASRKTLYAGVAAAVILAAAAASLSATS